MLVIEGNFCQNQRGGYSHNDAVLGAWLIRLGVNPVHPYRDMRVDVESVTINQNNRAPT
jgi:hypothetical protein